MSRKWKMERPCADCPFSDSEAGTHLRKSLAPGRITEIKRALAHDQHFICHKTTESTGNGSRLVCAGALAWQEQRGYSSQYVRICERLESLSGSPLLPSPCANTAAPSGNDR